MSESGVNFENPENVILLGTQVDEIFRRRGLDLARAISENKYDKIVFLDESARPVRELAMVAWDKQDQPRKLFPQSLFLHIGKEKTYERANLRPTPTSLDDLRQQYSEPQVQDLIEVIKRSRIAENGRVLIVDEWFGTGSSSNLASSIIKLIRPDLAADQYWLIKDDRDKNYLIDIYDHGLPWRSTPKNTKHSLVIEDIKDDGPSFISKPQRQENQQQALKFRKGLIQWFKNLYTF